MGFRALVLHSFDSLHSLLCFVVAVIRRLLTVLSHGSILTSNRRCGCPIPALPFFLFWKPGVRSWSGARDGFSSQIYVSLIRRLWASKYHATILRNTDVLKNAFY